ncbi:MAG: AMP-binding enzyme [Solirubrobacteraceae bacterium]
MAQGLSNDTTSTREVSAGMLHAVATVVSRADDAWLWAVEMRDDEANGPAVGGLEVRGDSCAASYWHQHEKTKRSMRGEWFVTGDRYERLADGAYAYVGRLDDMLKVGGLWVSPVDMEHVLMEHPKVVGVGVVAVTVAEASRIAAFVDIDGAGDDALADDLREFCKQRMRRYEYPHIVHFVEELPRTLTGKVQRSRGGRRWVPPHHAEPSPVAWSRRSRKWTAVALPPAVTPITRGR